MFTEAKHLYFNEIFHLSMKGGKVSILSQKHK